VSNVEIPGELALWHAAANRKGLSPLVYVSVKGLAIGSATGLAPNRVSISSFDTTANEKPGFDSFQIFFGRLGEPPSVAGLAW
jgi:hypothetical protein